MFLWKTLKSQLNELHDFRQVNWGSSENQVRNIELNILEYDGDNTLFYKTKLLGQNCLTVYHFMKDSLIGSTYVFFDANDNQNITITQQADDMLTQKYGAAFFNDILWTPDIRKYKVATYSDLASSIANGDTTQITS